MKKIMKAMTAVASFMAVDASAAEFLRLPNSYTLVMLGEIDLSDVMVLNRYLDAGVREIFLSSPGGDLAAAWVLGGLVKDHNVKISLTEGVNCSSACAILFLHASQRSMASDSKIGLHLPYFSEVGASQRSEACEALRVDLASFQGEIKNSISRKFPGLLAEIASHKSDPANYEFNASHILVTSEREAIAIRAKIDGGADFAEVARQNSTGPSGPSGGELGWLKAGKLVAEFEAAIIALDVGDVSDPVQTQFGWHVIRLNDVRRHIDSSENFSLRREVGFTDFSTCITRAYQLGAIEFLRISDLLSQASVDGVILRAMLATPSNEMFWLDESMARQFGMSTE